MNYGRRHLPSVPACVRLSSAVCIGARLATEFAIVLPVVDHGVDNASGEIILDELECHCGEDERDQVEGIRER